MYFSLIHQRTTRTSTKEIGQGHIISSGSKTYRATLVTIVKKYWRLKHFKILHFDTISNYTPSDTSCTSPSNDRLQFSNAAPLERNLRHMPLRIAPFSTSLPFKLPSRSLTTCAAAVIVYSKCSTGSTTWVYSSAHSDGRICPL